MHGKFRHLVKRRGYLPVKKKDWHQKLVLTMILPHYDNMMGGVYKSILKNQYTGWCIQINTEVAASYYYLLFMKMVTMTGVANP